MKRILFTILLLAANTFVFAQQDYKTQMSDNISKLNITDDANDLAEVANVFDKIANDNGTWQSYYFAAYSYLKKGKILFQENKLDEIDEAAEMAEKYAVLAELKNPETAEIPILFKMIHQLKMMVSPQERFASETELGNKFLIVANKLDQNNPRLTLAKAEELYYNPTQNKENKAKAKELLNKALVQFKAFKPETEIDPNWGLEHTEFLLKNINK